MEKKTTQRIIGMLVVIALVIILLPLLFGKNDLTTQAATAVKAPIPEEQSKPVEAANNSSQEIVIGPDGQPVASNSDVVASNAPTTASNDGLKVADASSATTPPATPQLPSNPVVNNSANAAKTDAVTPTQDPAAAMQSQAAAPQNPETPAVSDDATPKQMSMPEVAPSTDVVNEDTAPKKAVMTSKPKKVKMHTASHADKSPLAKLKSTAWVVQMGVFKDKANATRLADKLRSSGYKAFTRDVKSAKSGNTTTHVLVGPEFKQASALQLSNQLEQRMNLHGIVTSIKPLEL